MTGKENQNPEVIHAEIVDKPQEYGEEKPAPADRLTRLAESVAFLGGAIYRIYTAFLRSSKDTPGKTDRNLSPPGRQRRERRGRRSKDKEE